VIDNALVESSFSAIINAPVTEQSVDRPEVLCPQPQTFDSRRKTLLLVMLSVIAGSADAGSLLGLGLFSAHVTGNMVILTSRIVARQADNACLVLTVPVFVLALVLTRLLVAGLEAREISSLRTLLLLQFVLLSGAFAFCLASRNQQDAGVRDIAVAGQLCVAAMAVQNALGQLSFRGAPSTTVMTTNLAGLIMVAGEALAVHQPVKTAEARHRVKETLLVILGFVAGVGLGAACFAIAGRNSLGLPTGLTLLAFLMSLAAKPVREK
jgi:uncharacterized membrane protein YoaK (UPF0700 family)